MRDGDFRVRGKEISRIEGLSDAVFGFAITLLVVSLEVPKTPDEVLHAMRGFIPFVMTFALLFLVWRTQFTFFRRYGLEDNKTVVLNAVLLFTILFFVYPLKFFFNTLAERLLFKAGFNDPLAYKAIDSPEMARLILLYGVGWAVVFIVFTLMYQHAYAQRDALQLTPVEEFDTREAIWTTRGAAVLGFLAGVTNFVPAQFATLETQAIAGYVGLAIVAPVMIVLFRRRKTRKKRRLAVLAAERAVIEA